MHLTLYAGAFRPEPIAQDDFESWEELCESLADLVSRESEAPRGSDAATQKEHMFAWAPHRLCVPYRKLANVAEVTLMVLDVDRCNLGVLLPSVEALGISALVYTSPSDDPSGPDDARRVRVVAPITRPLTAEECPTKRKDFAEVLGLRAGSGVEGAIDAAKIFFAGRLHDTPEREIWRFDP
jgi:hypothetical protein